jgi:hypothetical protein
MAVATRPELGAYAFWDRGETMRFVERRPALWPVLEEAPRRVASVFGSELPLRLRLFRDRENPESEELVVELITGMADADAWDEAERKLRELYDGWLVKLPRDLTREVLFVVEPR